MKQLLSELLPAQSGRERALAIVAGILFVLSFALLTGVDVNPMQALVALPMLAVSAAMFNKLDKGEQVSSDKFQVSSKAAAHREAA